MAGLLGFPKSIEVVLGSGWTGKNGLSPSEVLILHHVPGTEVWTEDGTEVPNDTTNRLRWRPFNDVWQSYSFTDRFWGVAIDAYDAGQWRGIANADMVFASGNDPYVFLDFFNHSGNWMSAWGGASRGFFGSSFGMYSPDIFASLTPLSDGLSIPQMTRNGWKSFDFSFYTYNGSGTAYYVVTDSAQQPTPQQIKDGQDHAGESAIRHGSWAVQDAGQQPNVNVPMDQVRTRYFYFVQETASGLTDVVSARFEINEIATPQDLRDVGTNATTRSAMYVLTNDLDMEEEPWSTFDFTGTLNGDYKTIRGMSSSLFRYMQPRGSVYNLRFADFGIESTQGGFFAAPLCAGLNDGHVSSSWAGEIDQVCAEDGTVTQTNASNAVFPGGLFGDIRGTGRVTNCYVKNVNVFSDGNANSASGGFCSVLTVYPSPGVTMRHCFAVNNEVKNLGQDTDGGGFGGIAYRDSTSPPLNISDCYWDTTAPGIEDAFQVVNRHDIDGIEGKTTAEMQDPGLFFTWDWSIWRVRSGQYPELRGFMEDPAETGDPGATPINTIEDLDGIRNNLSGHYILMRDLDFNDDSSYQDPANKSLYTTGQGWVPLGNDYNINSWFTGLFNGQGHKVTGLYINRPSADFVGLFGRLASAHVRDLRVWADVEGRDYVGGLGGQCSYCTITQCYTTGNVTGSQFVGGLVGVGRTFEGDEYAASTIAQCYSTAHVTATVSGGGLVGQNFRGTITQSYASGWVTSSDIRSGGLVGENFGTITQCYSTAQVTPSYIGGTNRGLIGFNGTNGTVASSYWDIVLSGQHASDGGTPKSPIEMMHPGTFINWDTSVWLLEIGEYPKLRAFIVQEPDPDPPGPVGFLTAWAWQANVLLGV